LARTVLATSSNDDGAEPPPSATLLSVTEIERLSYTIADAVATAESM
jgi:hypothetical protein